MILINCVLSLKCYIVSLSETKVYVAVLYFVHCGCSGSFSNHHIIQYTYCLFIIRSVGLTHPIEAQSDSDMWNLKVKATS